MAMRRMISICLLQVLLCGANPAPFSLTSVGEDLGALSVSDMESMFTRSEDTHYRSMAIISKSLTMPKAMAVMNRLDNSSSLEAVVASLLGQKSSLRGQDSKHKGKKQPAGYGGIDGARKMLNDMIYESMSKYDQEIAKCTEFYSKQCALMEVARGAIAAANYVAANSRALILDAQGNINKCEVAIPETKQELKEHNTKCKNELKKLNSRLKIVMGDIAVMTMILKMTDCDAKFLQMKKLVMLRCEDRCTKEHHVSFNHKDLQQTIGQLKSDAAQNLMKQSFDDMFDQDAPVESVTMVQVANSAYQEPVVNKTKFNNPPIPRTAVPTNPCTDPNKGAPSAADKRAAKCSLGKSPQCYKLQSRFLAIQGGIADERDELLQEISELELACKEQKETLETAIQNDQDLLDSSQTKLAMATEKESSAGEEARQTAKENEQYNNDLIKQMKTCSNNYIGFETELCALKKIRGELYKLKGSGHSAFFQDCEVSKWDPEECTKVCNRGEQKLTRSVLTPRKGGTKCLPLAAERSCNNFPCPVDCALDVWGGWSKCSAKCGGGVTQRVRDVKLAMRHGGKPCSAVSEAKACAIEACEKDCTLGSWTKWTGCSKDCDGGTKKRSKFIKNPAEGSGKCPSQWNKARLQYRKCNMKRCRLAVGAKSLRCNTTMDVMMLIDICPKSGEDGFKKQIETANTLVDAFINDPNYAIISYCGPRTWSGVSQCAGKSSKKVDIETVCKVKINQHFTEDKKKAQTILNALTYQRGTKLTALALLAAKSELTLGRKEAHSVVIAFQDGQPLSFRKTALAARSLRKKARLLFVVVTKFAPLKPLKKWATRRWQENIVKVSDVKKLSRPDTTTAVIADICPTKFAKLKFGRK